MRLVSLVRESTDRLDMEMLEVLAAEHGIIGKQAALGLKKCAADALKRRADAQLKKQANYVLDGVQRMLLDFQEENRPVLASNLNYLSIIRWRFIANQETYNIDLKIRQALDKAKKFGIKV